VRSASGRDFSPLRHSPSCSGRPVHTCLPPTPRARNNRLFSATASLLLGILTCSCMRLASRVETRKTTRDTVGFAKASHILNDKFCRKKIRPRIVRIVFDLTIHREHFYRVDLINLTFHFDINLVIVHFNYFWNFRVFSG
jgi:hypothetical protein